MGGWVLYGAQISWPGCRDIDRRFFAQKFQEFRERFLGQPVRDSTGVFSHISQANHMPGIFLKNVNFYHMTKIMKLCCAVDP